MTRDEFAALGGLHKKYETLGGDVLMPDLPFAVRLDGKSFHTFTKGLKRPYDENLAKCLKEVTAQMVIDTNALIGYCQSDEITLVFPARSTHPYGGRRNKINTLFAARASVLFARALDKHLPSKSGDVAVFDCRSFQYPTEELFASNLIWRESDATRNSITMAASAHFGPHDLHKKNRAAQHDMLHSVGINWNDYPTHFKRGVYFQTQKEQSELPEETWLKIPEKHRPANWIVTRNVIKELELPVNTTITNFTDVIFRKASPVTIIGKCLTQPEN